jgi:hypothetical protein
LVVELIGLIEDGNIYGLPRVTCADLRHAYKLYREPVAYVHE